MMTIIFNWKTVSVVERLMPISMSYYSTSPASGNMNAKTGQPPTVVAPEAGINISVQPPITDQPENNSTPPDK